MSYPSRSALALLETLLMLSIKAQTLDKKYLNIALPHFHCEEFKNIEIWFKPK